MQAWLVMDRGKRAAGSGDQAREAPSAEQPSRPASPDRSAAPVRRHGTAAIVVVLLITAVLFAVTISSTLAALLLGGILAAFAQPLHQRIRRRWPGRTGPAAVMTAILVLAVVLPLGGLLVLVVERLASILSELSAAGWLKPGSRLQPILREYPSLERLFPRGLAAQLTGAAQYLARLLPRLLAGMASGAVDLFLTVIAIFYFLRDGDWLFARVERALPLEPRHTRAIAREFGRVGRAVVLGTLGTALLQGTIAGVGFWLVGLPTPLLLGALTVVAAIVPIVGTSLVFVPVIAYLLLVGELARALILLGLWLTVVGLIDNLIRPLLDRWNLRLHPLVAFLGLFGGLATFGPSGLYLGPLIAALFVAVVRIYEEELSPAAQVA